MTDAGFATAKAIYDALLAALITTAGSPSLVTGIYDGKAPAGTAYPYVTIGGENSVSADGIGLRMDERFVTLSVWSTYRGTTEVRGILSAIKAALHNQRLAMQSGHCVLCRVIRSSNQADADDVTRMGQVTLSIKTQD